MKNFITSLAIAAIITLGTALAMPETTFAQGAATYSCGSYGAGNYSANDACADTGATAPNTGFAGTLSKLAEPAVAIPVGLSLAALIAGIVLLVSKRRKKRLSFDN